jgi:hypothetical protein
MVLRKLGEQDSSKTAEDESTQIKKAFEERLSQYKAAKGNRRTSLFFPRKKKEEDEKAMHAAKEAAMAETAKDMREKEMQRQAQLEALQRRLDEAEAEKNKYKTEAEMEHERAETQSKRALEEEGKRVEVEVGSKLSRVCVRGGGSDARCPRRACKKRWTSSGSSPACARRRCARSSAKCRSSWTR